jgi:hypothetical protein
MPVTINGTTGVDLIKDSTVVQADLGANVAGNGPALRVLLAANFVMGAPGIFTIPFATKAFDTNNRFNNTAAPVSGIPAYSFMPDVAGYYSVSIAAGSDTSTGRINPRILKNNIVEALGGDGPAATFANTVVGLVYLNGTTDYITASVYTSAALTLPVAAQYTYFQAFLARSA